MKTVKDLCLGVAVAGLVAGAGSALGCAVASADAGTSDSVTADARSDAVAESSRAGGPSRKANASASDHRQRTATRAESAVADADAGGRPAEGGEVSGRAAVRVGASDSGADSRASDSAIGGAQGTVAVPAATTAAQPGSPVVDLADRITVPAVASVPTASPRPAAATAPADHRVTVGGIAQALADAVAALLGAPAGSLQSVAPLPLPSPTPVLPAGALPVMASSSAGRSRNAGAAQVGDDTDPTHVLLIGTDGTNLSKILEYTYDDPNSGFRVVMDQGVTGATSLVGHTTISGPSWTTILTGVWDSKSGVINNLFDPAPYIPWPTVFNQLEYFDSTIDTAVFANWKYINDIAAAGSYPVAPANNVFVEFSNSWEDTDDLVVDATIARINATQATDSTFMFSYQVAVDEAGHAHGGGSPEYAAAVVNTSENIARIMDAIDAWETANPGQEWTVIVTTDHGHQQSVGFGHGFQSPNETSSFVIFDLEGDGANDGKQNLAYTTADITPTIVSLFGAPSRSDFDGAPLYGKVTSIVDPTDLKQALDDAIAMYGYPNIGVNIALGVRTVFASIPYFLDGFVTTVTDQLQAIIDADIFLVSALAGVAEFVVQIVGDIAVGTTQALARVVATLTGSGVIPPSDPPLPPPSSAALETLLPAAVLV